MDHLYKTRFMLLYYSYIRPLWEARGNHCHRSLNISCRRPSSYSYCLNEYFYSWRFCCNQPHGGGKTCHYWWPPGGVASLLLQDFLRGIGTLGSSGIMVLVGGRCVTTGCLRGRCLPPARLPLLHIVGREGRDAGGPGERERQVQSSSRRRGSNEAANQAMHGLRLDLVALVVAARVGPVGGAVKQGEDIPRQGRRREDIGNPGTELHSVDDEDVQMYQSRTSGACICSCSTMDAPQHAFVLASRRDNPTRLKGADEILAKAAEDRRNGHSDAIAEDRETSSPDAERDGHAGETPKRQHCEGARKGPGDGPARPLVPDRPRD